MLPEAKYEPLKLLALVRSKVSLIEKACPVRFGPKGRLIGAGPLGFSELMSEETYPEYEKKSEEAFAAEVAATPASVAHSNRDFRIFSPPRNYAYPTPLAMVESIDFARKIMDLLAGKRYSTQERRRDRATAAA